MKKTYQVPTLTIHGDASQLTQATTVGTKLDRMIPAGTPTSQLAGIIATSLS